MRKTKILLKISKMENIVEKMNKNVHYPELITTLREIRAEVLNLETRKISNENKLGNTNTHRKHKSV